MYFGLGEATTGFDEVSEPFDAYPYRGTQASMPVSFTDGLLTVAECAMNGVGLVISYAEYFRHCYVSWKKGVHISDEPYMMLEWPFLPTFDFRVNEDRVTLSLYPEVVDYGQLINGYISEKASEPGIPLRRFFRSDATMGSKWYQHIDEDREVGPYSEYVATSKLGDQPEITRQISEDVERFGVVGSTEGVKYAEDCMEITLAYVLGFNPRRRYIQGMVDWCYVLKSVGQLDNARTFRLLIHMIEDVAKIFCTRSHALGQMYSQIYPWMKEDLGDILVRLEERARLDGQEQWELPASILEQHVMFMGTRGLTLENTVSILDFILVNGRAGLMAMFFAKLELGHPYVMVALGQESGSYKATQLLNQQIPIGFFASNLIEIANEYMTAFVGLVPFDQTIEIIDLLVEKHIENRNLL